jgi:hypothetical protein
LPSCGWLSAVYILKFQVLLLPVEQSHLFPSNCLEGWLANQVCHNVFCLLCGRLKWSALTFSRTTQSTRCAPVMEQSSTTHACGTIIMLGIGAALSASLATAATQFRRSWTRRKCPCLSSPPNKTAIKESSKGYCIANST